MTDLQKLADKIGDKFYGHYIADGLLAELKEQILSALERVQKEADADWREQIRENFGKEGDATCPTSMKVGLTETVTSEPIGSAAPKGSTPTVAAEKWTPEYVESMVLDEGGSLDGKLLADLPNLWLAPTTPPCSNFASFVAHLWAKSGNDVREAIDLAIEKFAAMRKEKG